MLEQLGKPPTAHSLPQPEEKLSFAQRRASTAGSLLLPPFASTLSFLAKEEAPKGMLISDSDRCSRVVLEPLDKSVVIKYSVA